MDDLKDKKIKDEDTEKASGGTDVAFGWVPLLGGFKAEEDSGENGSNK